ncbi:MAG: zf-TFIIB domain-containing protein [bacterium]
MDCPNCKNELTESVVHGITIDECIPCGTFWFDAGELENYLSAKLKTGKDQISLLSRFAPLDCDLEEFCPKCKQEKLICGKVGKLSLSRCGKCNGFFIDKNQIQAGRGSACEPLAEALLIELVGQSVLSLLDSL